MGTDEQHTYRIGVVEDHAVAVAGLRQILSADPSPVIVGAAATVADLLAETTGLDLAILDLRLLDGSSPITNVEQLRNEGIETLVFTSGDEPFLVRAAGRAGVLGVVQKSEREQVVAAAGRDAAQGRMVPTLDWAAAIDADGDFAQVNLSPRQREVLNLYASGEPAARMAHLTGPTEDTVNAYLGRIQQKSAAARRPARTKTDLYKRALERMAADTTARPLTPDSAGGSAEERLTNLFFLFLSSGYLAYLAILAPLIVVQAGLTARGGRSSAAPWCSARPSRWGLPVCSGDRGGRAGPRRRALCCSSLRP